MIVVPINVPDESFLLVIIERDNLDRMRKADPITIESVMNGGQLLLQIASPENLSIIIAYEEDDVALYKLAKTGDVLEMLRYVQRGRRFDPKVDGVDNIVSLKQEPAEWGGEAHDAE